ncbi:hypothetical protein ABKN59_007287 [Abortiporus biennis]
MLYPGLRIAIRSSSAGGRDPKLLQLLGKTRSSSGSSLPSSHIRLFSNTVSIMSDTTKKYNFVVFAPDYTDDECLSRRLAVRSAHLANAAHLHGTGALKVGGAMITPETYTTDSKKMIGSTMIFEASNLEEVKKLIENDVYYTGNVWDKEKLVILPYFSAHPLP